MEKGEKGSGNKTRCHALNNGYDLYWGCENETAYEWKSFSSAGKKTKKRKKFLVECIYPPRGGTVSELSTQGFLIKLDSKERRRGRALTCRMHALCSTQHAALTTNRGSVVVATG